MARIDLINSIYFDPLTDKHYCMLAEENGKAKFQCLGLFERAVFTLHNGKFVEGDVGTIVHFSRRINQKVPRAKVS